MNKNKRKGILYFLLVLSVIFSNVEPLIKAFATEQETPSYFEVYQDDKKLQPKDTVDNEAQVKIVANSKITLEIAKEESFQLYQDSSSEEEGTVESANLAKVTTDDSNYYIAFEKKQATYISVDIKEQSSMVLKATGKFDEEAFEDVALELFTIKEKTESTESSAQEETSELLEKTNLAPTESSAKENESSASKTVAPAPLAFEGLGNIIIKGGATVASSSDYLPSSTEFFAQVTAQTKVTPFGGTTANPWTISTMSVGAKAENDANTGTSNEIYNYPERWWSIIPDKNSPKLSNQTYGVKYTNVGTYSGHTVDLKITVMGWERYTDDNGGKGRGKIGFGIDRLGCTPQGYYWVDQKWEFFVGGGTFSESINVNGYATVNDLDCCQSIKFDAATSPKITQVYVPTNETRVAYQQVSGEKEYSTTDANAYNPSDLKNMFTFLYHSHSLRFKWGSYQDKKINEPKLVDFDEGNKANPSQTPPGPYISWGGDTMGFIAQKPMRSEPLPPYKKVSGTDTPIDQLGVQYDLGTNLYKGFKYTIHAKVPYEESDFYYNNYKITDDLEPGLLLNDSSKSSFKVVDEFGKDWTSKFILSMNTSTNHVEIYPTSTFRLSWEFYNREFYYSFKTQFKSGVDLSKYYDTSTNKLSIKNQAVLNVTEKNASTPKKMNTNEVVTTAELSCNLGVEKVNESGVRIAGAVFQLTNKKTNVTKKVTSVANKRVYFEELTVGEYTLKEITAPPGYAINPTVVTVKLTPNANKNDLEVSYSGITAGSGVTNNGFYVTYTDKLLTQDIKVKKVDETGKVRSGAEFELLNSSGASLSPKKTATSLSDGYATFTDIKEGTYKLKETKAPTGCEPISGMPTVNVTLDTGTNTLKVSYSNLPVGMTVVNGELVITNSLIKKASAPKKTVTSSSSAKDYKDNELDILTSGQEDVTVNNVVRHSYFIAQSTKDSSGNILSKPNKLIFEDVLPDGVTPVMMFIYNTDLALLSDGLLLPNTHPTSFVKNSNGTTTIKYELTSAQLDSIKLDGKDLVFCIIVDVSKKRSSITQPFYMENEASVTWGSDTNKTNKVKTQMTPEPFTLKLIKQDLDDSNTKLNGVEFELTHPDNSKTTHTTAGTQASKAKGEIDFGELKAGKYTLKETKTVSGYQLIASSYTFEVKSDGTVTHDSNSGSWQYSINDRAITLTANNKRKPSLPFTGGPGSQFFRIVCLILLLVVLILGGRAVKNYRYMSK